MLSNLGPLTTTFTPAPTCTGANVDGAYQLAGFDYGWVSQPYLCGISAAYRTAEANQCRPGPAAGRLYDTPYHSPGVVCPERWTTAFSVRGARPTGGAARESRTSSYYSRMFSLDKSETLILCCPEEHIMVDGVCVGNTRVTSIDPKHQKDCTTTGYTDLRNWAQPVPLIHNAEDMNSYQAAVTSSAEGSKSAATPASISATATVTVTVTPDAKNSGTSLKKSLSIAIVGTALVASYIAILL